MEVTETTAAFPSGRFRHTAWIFAVDDLLQARDDVRVAVLTEFNHNPTAAHLLGDCTSSAGTCERIKNDVAGTCCNIEDLSQQFFGFGGAEHIGLRRQDSIDFLFGLLCVSRVRMAPDCSGNHTALHLRKKHFSTRYPATIFSPCDSVVRAECIELSGRDRPIPSLWWAFNRSSTRGNSRPAPET